VFPEALCDAVAKCSSSSEDVLTFGRQHDAIVVFQARPLRTRAHAPLAPDRDRRATGSQVLLEQLGKATSRRPKVPVARGPVALRPSERRVPLAASHPRRSATP
jgi:hypothetical protein